MAKFIQYMTRDSLYDGPFDDVSGWPAAGMGYVVVTDKGRLLVVDGGQPNDAEPLIELLAEQCGAESVFVDSWIITHAHLDHYGAVREIAKNEALKNRISVGEFVYLFPDDFYSKNGKHQSFADQEREMQEIAKALGAKCVTPQRGDIVTLDDVTVEYVYVPDDCSVINTSNGSANLCSLVFIIAGRNKRVMMTGDAYRRSLTITAWRYAGKLKCEILQMPHHALCDSVCGEFYNCVDPEELLFPISTAGYRAMHSDYYTRLEACKINLALEEKAKKSYKAFEGNAEFYI